MNLWGAVFKIRLATCMLVLHFTFALPVWVPKTTTKRSVVIASFLNAVTQTTVLYASRHPILGSSLETCVAGTRFSNVRGAFTALGAVGVCSITTGVGNRNSENRGGYTWYLKLGQIGLHHSIVNLDRTQSRTELTQLGQSGEVVAVSAQDHRLDFLHKWIPCSGQLMEH